MTPMIPKISVSPDATRNSSSPYCSAFRHWMRKVAMSMGSLSAARLAAAGRIVQCLAGHTDPLVLLALHLAQVDVLHRVVSLGQGERAARAVDGGLLHGGGELRLLADVALHRGQADRQDLARVVALNRVDVGLLLVGLGIGEAEAVVARRVERVGVVQRGEDALCGVALRFQRAVGEEAGPVQRDALVEARAGIVL